LVVCFSRYGDKLSDTHFRVVETALSNVKIWLAPPLWQPALEAALSKRYPGTTSGHIQTPTYQNWRTKINIANVASPSTPAPNTSGQLLHLHGKKPDGLLAELTKSIAKPGYGKTIIAATIVQDCKFDVATESTPANPMRRSTSLASSAFYFFNKQEPAQSTSDFAFRAVIAQLLHIHQHDHEVIDLAVLMTGHKSCGQATASSAEVCELLAIYLKRFPATILIFDGVDECHDYSGFLRQLGIISADTNCKILLSSRPTVDSSSYFRGFEIYTMRLEDEGNIDDIEHYVRPEVQNLFLSEKLDEDESLDDIVSRICKRSRSMFLWANLMIGYLSSDFLTPADRHEAITELNSFESLELMYLRILESIKSQCKGKKAWVNVQRLFQWVSMARRPLQVDELREAIAIEIGKPMVKNRYLPKFRTTLTKMSGALIEITSEETVRFIHLSVLEFLAEAMESTSSIHGAETSPLLIVPQTLHCSISAECISYLIHSVSNQHPRGSPRLKLEPRKLLKRSPMALYATHYWASHAYEALAVIRTTNTATISLIDFITKFISNKVAVTAWTEACWTFGSPPDLCGLLHEPGELFSLFAQDLKKMNQQWGSTLKTAPNEIWEPSIPAFMQSRFWVGTDSARLSVLGTNLEDPPTDLAVHQGSPLTIASRTSANDLEVGIIKIWPSRYVSQQSLLAGMCKLIANIGSGCT
jgi:hypothetical protein